VIEVLVGGRQDEAIFEAGVIVGAGLVLDRGPRQ
jgi:hypothetical protein